MKKHNNDNVTADRLQGCSRLLTREEAAAYCRLSPARVLKLGKKRPPAGAAAGYCAMGFEGD